MDPLSAATAELLVHALRQALKEPFEAWPTVMLSQLLRQVLELGSLISDELDRRQGI